MQQKDIPTITQSHFTIQYELPTFEALLCRLGQAIRAALHAQQHRPTAEHSAVAAQTSADTIYQIDKVSEILILDWLAIHWPSEHPIRLIMEGIEDKERLTFPENTPETYIASHLIIDPIDGTRGLMYDKRPAWALIGLAQKTGPDAATSLEDICVAVMTELPTSKQYLSEQLSATRSPEGSTTLSRVATNLITGDTKSISHNTSQASDINHGFVSVAKFFPQAKAALAAFEEELIAELTPLSERQDALVFDDQYISTGGQLYELIAGHDRMIVDIRPLAYQKHGFSQSLSCHPYDLCTALVARAAGVVVRLPSTPQLDVPLDTTTPVNWIAYANHTLADTIHPVLETLLEKHFA